METPAGLNFPAVINIIAIGQALVLASIYLKRRKQTGISGSLLIALLLVFAFDLFHDMLIHTRYFYQFPHLLGLGSAFTYLKGPLIYFYIRSYLKPSLKFKPVHALHLLPFIYKHVEAWPTYSLSITEKLSFLDNYYFSLDNGQTMTSDLVSVYGIIWHLHPLVYLIAGIYLINQWQGNKSSKWYKHVLRLKIIVLAYLGIWLFTVISYYLSAASPGSINTIGSLPPPSIPSRF